MSDALDQIFNAGECGTAIRDFVRVLKPAGELRILTARWPHIVRRVLRREGLEGIEELSIAAHGESRAALLFEGRVPSGAAMLV